jgi:hypothetical protein
MRDDVIIINIHVVNSMWPVAVVERKARSHGVNEVGSSNVVRPITLIGVVRLFQDGAALAKIVDGDPD